MNITQQPDSLSLSLNLKDFIISSDSQVSFVLRQNGEDILSQLYNPSTNGHITINLKDVIHGRLATIFKDLSEPYEQTQLTAEFIAFINDIEIKFRIVRGGVDRLTDSATNFLTQNFLTWQPGLKPVTYYTPEYLTYYATSNSVVKLKAYFLSKTGETTSQEIDIVSIPENRAYTIPLQYSIVAGRLNNRLPSYYDVWIENSSGYRLTYVQRYYVSEMSSEQEQWILFENSLGGIDTFRAYGDMTFAGEHTHNLAEINEETIEYRVDTERKFQKNTGFLDDSQRKWLLDFFPSQQKYIYIRNFFRKIVVSESNVAYSYRELPSSYSFTYKYADAKPLLNLPRTDIPAEVLHLSVPELGSFTVPPRLAEFPSLPLTEGALFPVQSPYSEEWGTATAKAIADFIINILSGSGGGSGGGSGHTHQNLDLLNLLSSVKEYLLIGNRKVKAGYADEAGIARLLETVDFSSGTLGTGASLSVDKTTGKSKLEIDEIFVRIKAVFKELVIEASRHISGELIISQAHMLCSKVEELGEVYRCYFDRGESNEDGKYEVEQEFTVGAQARHWVFTGKNQKYYWRLVTAVGEDYIDLSKTDCDTGSDIPTAGDAISQLGHRTDIDGMSAIVLSSHGTGNPSIKQYDYIDSYSLVDKEVEVTSPHGNKYVGDFFLKTGVNIATQLQVLENLIMTEIQSVEYVLNEKDNHLYNAAFTKDMEGWNPGESLEVYTNEDLIVANDGLLADADKIAEVMPYEGKLWLRLKDSSVIQPNGNITPPVQPGRYYVSLRYVCTGSGTISCGFEDTEMFHTAPVALTRNARMLEFTGIWDGTGDFLIRFTGDIYINLVALTNRPLDDYKLEVSSKLKQLSDSISAVVKSVDTVNKTIKDSGWLTTADGSKIWASCVFPDGTKAISLFDVTPDGIFLAGNHLNLKGVVTFESFSESLVEVLDQTFKSSETRAKSDVARQLGFSGYNDLVANAASGKAILVGGYLNLELIDVDTLISEKVLTDKLKAVSIETGRLTAKEGCKIGGLTIGKYGSIFGSSITFESCANGYNPAFSITSAEIKNLIINNIGLSSSFQLVFNISGGTYPVMLPDYEDIVAAVGGGVGGGFDLKLFVPAKWGFTNMYISDNDSRFLITAKEHANLYDNNGNKMQNIEMAKGDYLELYGLVSIEKSEVPSAIATSCIDYYIKTWRY